MTQAPLRFVSRWLGANAAGLVLLVALLTIRDRAIFWTMIAVGVALLVVNFVIVSRRNAAKVRGQRAAELNRCPNCEYDLTGNTSGRCSECGVTVFSFGGARCD